VGADAAAASLSCRAELRARAADIHDVRFKPAYNPYTEVGRRLLPPDCPVRC
jgi:hypothetical protein